MPKKKSATAVNRATEAHYAQLASEGTKREIRNAWFADKNGFAGVVTTTLPMFVAAFGASS